MGTHETLHKIMNSNQIALGLVAILAFSLVTALPTDGVVPEEKMTQTKACDGKVVHVGETHRSRHRIMGGNYVVVQGGAKGVDCPTEVSNKDWSHYSDTFGTHRLTEGELDELTKLRGPPPAKIGGKFTMAFRTGPVDNFFMTNREYENSHHSAGMEPSGKKSSKKKKKKTATNQGETDDLIVWRTDSESRWGLDLRICCPYRK